MRRRPVLRGIAIALFGVIVTVLGGLALIALMPPQPAVAGFVPGQLYFPVNPRDPDASSDGGMLAMMREPSFVPDSSMKGMSVRYRLLTMPSFSRPDMVRIDVASNGEVRVSVTTLSLNDDASGYVWSGCRAGGTRHRGTRAAIDARLAPLGLKPGINDRSLYGLDGVHYLIERRTVTAHEILIFSGSDEPQEQAVLDAFAKVGWTAGWYCRVRNAARASTRLLGRKFGLD